MKNKWMKTAIVMMFILSLSVAAHAKSYTVTIKNDAYDKDCVVWVFHRAFGEVLSGHLWLRGFGSQGTISAPGAYCIAYLEYACTPSYGGTSTGKRIVGCLGTSGSTAETCCWDSSWEIYYNTHKQDVEIKKK